MPRQVRNFWVDVYIDGRKTTFEGGPRNKEGGMVISIFQRDKGSIRVPCTIYCSVERDGTLKTEIEDHTSNDAITTILRSTR